MIKNNKILLINDDENVSGYLREKLVLNGEYAVQIASSSVLGVENLKQNNFGIVLANFHMPDMQGNVLVKNLRQINPDVIIIILCNGVDSQISREITELGVYDCLITPVDIEKLRYVVKKGVDLYELLISQRKMILTFKEQNQSLQKQNIQLAHRIEESARNLARLYEDLRSTYMRTIRVLAHAIDARDHYTHSHSENVARYAVIIAEELNLTVEQIEKIRDASELHDLGKIGVEDCILTKPGALTDEEWEKIKQHPLIGAQILEPLTFLGEIVDLVKQHHEHFDGSGYPFGLRGEEIFLGARVLQLADAYEAMRSARSYREIPFTKAEAVAEIKKQSGTQFDPKVVDAFLKIEGQFP